ncbi:ATP-dependent DNA helicase PcrA [Streptococcus pneumoniae]|nr:ATP-dependent DNA helicase PcrA [Streptococcus pneumoniae]
MNALLNGMNDRQAEAVQTTEGSLANHGRGWFWKDSCFNPPYRLFD